MKAEPTLREPVPDNDCREAMRPCREGETATCDRQGCQGDNFTRRLTCCRRCELQTWQLQTISAGLPQLSHCFCLYLSLVTFLFNTFRNTSPTPLTCATPSAPCCSPP